MTRTEIIELLEWEPALAVRSMGSLLGRIERIVAKAKESEHARLLDENRRLRNALAERPMCDGCAALARALLKP